MRLLHLDAPTCRAESRSSADEKPAQIAVTSSRTVGAEMRRKPVVQRERIALVLDDDARLAVRERRELVLQLRIEQRLRARHRPVGETHLGAVARDARQFQRLEEQIEFGERPAADERQRPADALGQPLKRNGQVGRDHDLERGRRQIEDGPVDVEQNGSGRHRNGVDEQFALQIRLLIENGAAYNAAGSPRGT